ncbi:hypothetical protein K3495_g13896 [Podosphaera aphanis]|nr:hypothetical protein K3495_g13896 [Podosphaera aphanis]
MANYGYGGGNFSTTTYGAQGGADGGGFLGGSQMGSQSSSGGVKSYGNNTLRPVTIKQVLEATHVSDGEMKPDREFKIDGAELTQITFVGQLQSISTQATYTTYKVDDGTGILEVKVWSDSDANPETSSPLPKENDYLRIWGRLKAFSTNRHVVAHMVRPVIDFNEVSYHLLEATAVHLFFTRGPPPSTVNIKNEPGSGMFVDRMGGSGSATNSIPSISAGKRLAANTSPTARKLYALLSELRSNEGVNVNLIAQRLGIQLSDALKAGDELLGTGAIYTTVDDETWAVLEY